MKARRLVLFAGMLAAVAAASWGGIRLLRGLTPSDLAVIPAAPARRTSVDFTITAKGSLQGGNSKMLTAPMTGSPQLVLTHLRKPGELVALDEVVAQFDTTEETFRLREAEADLAEAGQQVIQAENEARAKEEELNAEMIKARTDLQVAGIECRRNPLIAAITAKQNDLDLASARERLDKLERDYPQRKAAASASIAIQDAAQKKAAVQAGTARKNMDKMTLRAPMPGYVNVERNTNSNWFFPGMTFPLFQVGDAVRPGMAVVQIPDMASWEVTARIAEQDRGYLNPGQAARFTIVALPGRPFRGKVTSLGGTTGPPWDRRFECKLSLEAPEKELRPGMSAILVVETGRMENVIAIPAQALFERDGKPFVWAATAGGYSPRDVKVIRRSESQVVVDGLPENQMVALASPEQTKVSQPEAKGAAKAIGR